MNEILGNKPDVSLKFRVQSLGSVAKGTFEHKPLTVFCGPSNSGKTWTMYALHHFYDLAAIASSGKKELLNPEGSNGPRPGKGFRERYREGLVKSFEFDQFHENLSRSLSEYFNAPRDVFAETQFTCQMEETDWSGWLNDLPDRKLFLTPAERSGLHLFYRELSTKRTALLHHASKERVDLNELLRDVMHSRYAQPIADYINWLNQLTEDNQSAGDFHNEAQYLQKKLTRGRYSLNRKTGDVTYQPYKKRGSATDTQALGLHAGSSTVKSLFGLWFYLEYQAKKGDLLMIDEPELNIHPENQLRIARLLAKLVNAGIQVTISTHSDYIVREFNNLILLNEDNGGALLKSIRKDQKIDYTEQEFLRSEQVGIYLFDQNRIQSMPYTVGEGFAVSTFDQVIMAQNQCNEYLYHALQEGGVGGE